MAEDTFVTMYRKEFSWPWELPIRFACLPPQKETFKRDLTCPPPPPPDCPCPYHRWSSHAGHYACLAEKDGLLNLASQKVRHEIKLGMNRNKESEEKNKSDVPPLLRDEPMRSCYAIDYARKDTVPITFVEMLAGLNATPVPPGPLGRTLYAAYTDPTPFRNSFFTKPLYDPTKPVERPPYPDVFDQYFNNYPGLTEYMDSYGLTAVRNFSNVQGLKYPPPLITYKDPELPAITAE